MNSLAGSGQTPLASRRHRSLRQAAPHDGPLASLRSKLTELGPIGLTLGGADAAERAAASPEAEDRATSQQTRAEWAASNLASDGTVSLWLEDDFNSASRLLPVADAEGMGSASAAKHAVVIRGRDGAPDFTVQAREDAHVLFEAEAQGFVLPAACRMGCCTVCAVRVRSGELHQPTALGLSAGMRAAGYALLCVAHARSEAVVELQDLDEVYELQFGAAFAAQATDPSARSVLRDDFALELAQGDE